MIRRPFAVFLVIFAATALYTLTRPKIYEATAYLQLPARVHQNEPVDQTVNNEMSSFICIKIAESSLILQRVARLIPTTTHEHLHAHRHAGYEQATRSLTISYRDRDPTIAAQVANLFAEEVNALFIRKQEYQNRDTMEFLRERANAQAITIEKLAAALAAHPASPDAAQPDPEYQKLERDLAVNREILTQIQARLTEARAYETSPPAFFTLTLATPPAPGDYVSPPVLLHLTLGALVGILAAVLTARRLRPQPAPPKANPH
jgi:uncharacterized protein involved in exopolysaccharide biosynthesis